MSRKVSPGVHTAPASLGLKYFSGPFIRIIDWEVDLIPKLQISDGKPWLSNHLTSRGLGEEDVDLLLEAIQSTKQ